MPGLSYERYLSRIDSASGDPREFSNRSSRHSWNSSRNTFLPLKQDTLDDVSSNRKERSATQHPSWKTEEKRSEFTEPNLLARGNVKAHLIQDSAGIQTSESETDLAAMVHEFIETGSHGFEQLDGSDSDHSSSNPLKLHDDLKVLTSHMSPLERSVLTALKNIIPLLWNKIDLICLDQGSHCKSSCVRGLIVKYLRSMGIDAAICKLRWQSYGKVLRGDSYAGEYEYLDVIFDKGYVHEKRLIIDLDFQSQFEIARPTQQYLETLKLLPAVFIGSVEKLDQILQVMSDAARFSLKQNSMHLPPWRTLDYMRAKWLSPPERISDCLSFGEKKDIHSSLSKSFPGHSENNQCIELLRRIRANFHCVSEKFLIVHKRGTSFGRKKKTTGDPCH